jgi:hypothetical protein
VLDIIVLDDQCCAGDRGVEDTVVELHLESTSAVEKKHVSSESYINLNRRVYSATIYRRNFLFRGAAEDVSSCPHPHMLNRGGGVKLPPCRTFHNDSVRASNFGKRFDDFSGT